MSKYQIIPIVYLKLFKKKHGTNTFKTQKVPIHRMIVGTNSVRFSVIFTDKANSRK